MKDAQSSVSTRKPSNGGASTANAAKPERRYMRIGRLAEQSRRTVHTIRWYESQNLILGVSRDPQGRRVYTEWHVEWLDLIDRLRCTGMSVRQIREYARLVKQGESTLKERQQMMRAHRERMEVMLAKLTESLALIDRKIDYYGRWLETGQRPPKPKRRDDA